MASESTMASKEALEKLEPKDLKRILKLKDKPEYGNKQQLITRLMGLNITENDVKTVMEQEPAFQKLEALKRTMTSPPGPHRKGPRVDTSPIRKMQIENQELPPGLPESEAEHKFTLNELSQLLDEKVVNPFNERFKTLETRIEQVAADYELANNVLEVNVENLDVRIRDLESSDLPSRVQQLEATLKAMKLSTSPSVSTGVMGDDEPQRPYQALFKNLDKDVDEKEAVQWLETSLLQVGAPEPESLFGRSLDYNGTLFAKFKTTYRTIEIGRCSNFVWPKSITAATKCHANQMSP